MRDHKFKHPVDLTKDLLLPPLFSVTTGEWGDKNNIPNDKEVIINGVCVMNQSSDYKSNDDEDVNMEKSNEDKDDNLTIAESNDEDEIKKSFIKKPNPIDSSDDVQVKKEVDEGWNEF